MSTDAQASWVPEFLASHPGFERTLRQFMTLHDAAGVLDELGPPHGGTAAAFLREVGRHIMREAGLPENFLEAMIANYRPAGATLPMPTAEEWASGQVQQEWKP